MKKQHIPTIEAQINTLLTAKREDKAEALLTLHKELKEQGLLGKSEGLIYFHLTMQAYEGEKKKQVSPTIFDAGFSLEDLGILFTRIRFYIWEYLYLGYDSRLELLRFVEDNGLSMPFLLHGIKVGCTDEGQYKRMLLALESV